MYIFCHSNNRAGFSISAFGTRGPSRAECHIDEHRRPVPARLLGRQEYVIGCQMTEISIKDGPIVIKTKRTSPISLSGRLFGTSFSLIYNDDNVSCIRRRRRLWNHCPYQQSKASQILKNLKLWTGYKPFSLKNN